MRLFLILPIILLACSQLFGAAPLTDTGLADGYRVYQFGKSVEVARYLELDKLADRFPVRIYRQERAGVLVHWFNDFGETIQYSVLKRDAERLLLLTPDGILRFDILADRLLHVDRDGQVFVWVRE